MNIQYDKVFERLYYFSIFLVLLPPFFLFSPLLYTHSLAGVIWALLFLILCCRVLNGRQKLKVDKNLLVLFLLLFFVQSISILTAQNIVAFFGVYKNIIFSSILFILSLYFIKNAEKLVYTLFLIAFINIILQALLFFYPNFFISMGELFLNKSYLDLLEANVFRGRTYIESYDEILIPIILYLLIKNKNRKILVLLLIFISIFSLVSGFRTRFIMLIFALASSIIIFREYFKKFFFVLLGIPFLIYLLYISIPLLGAYSTIDRLLLVEGRTLTQITTGRLRTWGEALNMGLSSPILGVGIGNYYDYLRTPKQRMFSFFQEANTLKNVASLDPHNIFFSTFAETGILGLGSFVVLLAYFIKRDFSILKGNKDLPKVFVLSFWTLFIYSLLNPTVSIAYKSLFWLLRASIEKIS